jgi:hypothetical protein
MTEDKMTEDIFSKGIGDKPAKKALEAKSVVVQGRETEPIFKKGTTAEERSKAEPIGNKLVLICKHPDKEETIKISQMVLRSGNTIKTSTIWINLDDDGNIEKGSHVATLLEKYQAPSIDALIGKNLQTELDESKFLAIKAY